MEFTHPDFTPPTLIDGEWQSKVFLPHWVGYKLPGSLIQPWEGPSYFAYRPFDGNVEVRFDTNERLTPD